MASSFQLHALASLHCGGSSTLRHRVEHSRERWQSRNPGSGAASTHHGCASGQETARQRHSAARGAASVSWNSRGRAARGWSAVARSPGEPARESARSRHLTPQRFGGRSNLRAQSGEGPGSLRNSIDVTTFNVLAPIYKRLGCESVRESHHRELWLARHSSIVEQLLAADSAIVCLQEFWAGDPEFAALYEDALEAAGYSTFVLSRTNNRGDGLLTAVKMDKLRVKHYHQLQFHDSGDRVAQILLLRGESDSLEEGPPPDLILVNTHLLFPHDASSSLIRIREVFKLLEHLEVYQGWHCHHPTPVVMCGDFNGTKSGEVFKFLRSQGFMSGFDAVRGIPDAEQGWVSHRSHRGTDCGVDYILYLNPKEHRPLAANWQTAAFHFLKGKFDSAGYSEQEQVFRLFCRGGFIDGVSMPVCDTPVEDGGDARDMTISMAAFTATVREIGREMELTEKEVHELMAFADTDCNGVVDYDEFSRILDRISMWQGEHEPAAGQPSVPRAPTSRGPGEHKDLAPEVAPEDVWVTVRDAKLVPSETEGGVWPDTYTMSDHAMLTASLSFITMWGPTRWQQQMNSSLGLFESLCTSPMLMGTFMLDGKRNWSEIMLFSGRMLQEAAG